MNDFPILSDPTKSREPPVLKGDHGGDDLFSPAMDEDQPSSKSNLVVAMSGGHTIVGSSSPARIGSSLSSENTKEKRSQRGNKAKSSTTSTTKRESLPSKQHAHATDGGVAATSSSSSPDSAANSSVDWTSGTTELQGWMPIIAAGSAAMMRRRPTTSSSSTIDDSEHSLSSIAAKRRPLSKETVMAQELAKEQQEELAALLAQSMETMEELEESSSSSSDGSSSVLATTTAIQHGTSTAQAMDWQDVAGEAYQKKISQPLAMSVDEQDSEDDDDDIRLRPKSRELQKVEEELRRQEEQLRSLMRETAEDYDAIRVTEVRTKKERKETKTTCLEWHDITGNSGNDHVKDIGKARDFLEEDEGVDNDHGPSLKSRSRGSQKIEDAARKQRLQLRNIIQETPDAVGALKVSNVLSRKERKETKTIKDEWHQIEGDAANSHFSKLEKTRDLMEDQDGDEGGLKPKSKLARSLEATVRKQQNSVDDTILESQDASDAIGKVKVFDNRQERRETRKKRSEWHNVDSKMKLDKVETYTKDQDAEEDDNKAKSKLSRSLVESTRKQNNLMDDIILDTPDASDALEKVRVFDNRQERRETRKKRREWHDVDSKMKRGVIDDDRKFYSQNPRKFEDDSIVHDAMALQLGLIPCVAPSSGEEESMSSTAVRNYQSEMEQMIIASAYPVSDRSIMDDDKYSQSTEPVMVLKKTIPTFDTQQQIEDPENLELVDSQEKHGWHGVNLAHYPSHAMGSYKQKEGEEEEEVSNAPNSSMNSREHQQSSKKPKEARATQRKTPHRPFEEATNGGKDACLRTPKPPTSLDGKRSNKSRGREKDANYGWERVSTHSKHDSSEKYSSSSSGRTGVVRSSSKHNTPVSTKEDEIFDHMVKPPTEDERDGRGDQAPHDPDGPFGTRPEINPFNHCLHSSSRHSQSIDSFAEPSTNQNWKEAKATRKDETHFSRNENKRIEQALKHQTQEIDEASGPPIPGNIFDMCPEINHSPRESAGSFSFPAEAHECKQVHDSDDGQGDITTQSEDRHIVRQASRRTLLRRKVDSRREALASMFHATQEHTLGTEHEVLDLKKKLTLSQALVQMLEVENDELAQSQIWSPKQLDDREKVLENTIKKLMEQRDAAVMECHELRILISGTCEVCRQRFDNHREYTMDYSVRHPILTKRKERISSTFEWITAGLADETRTVKTEDDIKGARYRAVADSDNVSTDTTLPESHIIENGPAFQFVPLQWLSTKIAQNALQAGHELSDNRPKNDRPDVIIYQNQDMAGRQSIARSTSKEQTDNTNEVAGDEVGSLDNMAGMDDALSNHSRIAATDEMPASSRMPFSFLGNFLAEKVHDEFSTLTTHPSQQIGSTRPGACTKQKSFFSSLFGETVDEGTTFAHIYPRSIQSKDIGSTNVRKLGMGLKGERVLDDMEIFNSIMSISEETSYSSPSKANKKSRSFGLVDEQVNEEEHDLQLLSALMDAPRNKTEEKKKGPISLQDEKFDDEDRDFRLLDLVVESSPNGTIERSPNPVTPRRGSNGHLLSPTSKISSPFTAHVTSPRKSVSTNKGRRGASSSVNYLGQFSVTDNSPRGAANVHESAASPEIDPQSGSPISRNPHFAALLEKNQHHNDDELDGERPWQRDSGGPRTSRLLVPSKPSLIDDEDGEEKLNGSFATPKDDYVGGIVGEEEEDLDQIAALVAIEGLQTFF